MPTSPEYAAYILDQLSGAGAITSRKMFGGVGVHIDSVFCAIIGSSNTFYLRVGPNNIEDLKQAGMQKFPGGKRAGMPYYEVPEDIAENLSSLYAWAAGAKVAAIVAKKK